MDNFTEKFDKYLAEYTNPNGLKITFNKTTCTFDEPFAVGRLDLMDEKSLLEQGEVDVLSSVFCDLMGRVEDEYFNVNNPDPYYCTEERWSEIEGCITGGSGVVLGQDMDIGPKGCHVHALTVSYSWSEIIENFDNSGCDIYYGTLSVTPVFTP